MITEGHAKFQEMFDQAMRHAMINQSTLLMDSIQSAIRDVMDSGSHVSYKGPSYSQLESLVTGAARAGEAPMTGSNSQPMPLSTVMPKLWRISNATVYVLATPSLPNDKPHQDNADAYSYFRR